MNDLIEGGGVLWELRLHSFVRDQRWDVSEESILKGGDWDHIKAS